jgi:cell fate regulator YaaT (PSP1 superfamily)
MEIREYLLAFGTMGDVGRFRPAQPVVCRRGDRAVVETHRGLELGTVLCPATAGHARFFVNTSVGRFLRLAGEEDEYQAGCLRQRADRLCEDSRTLAAELGLPLAVLDAEVLLDGRQAVLYHLRWQECDERPLVSALSKRHDLHLALHSLALLAGGAEAEEEPGGCGSCGADGCGSCAGGDCGTCPTKVPETALITAPARSLDPPWQAHFAALRERMHASGRTPLL